MRQSFEVSGSVPAIIRNNLGIYEGDLRYYYWVVFHNAQNLNNPYHNFRHIFHVMYLCYQACLFYADLLTGREMRNLLIASLFHDFDHTGKAGPDVVNIERAVAALEKHIASEDVRFFEDIAYLIRVTQYPYVIPSDGMALLGLVIRDADLGQALSPAWIQHVVFGLAAEWGKDPLEVLKMQPGFHANLKFGTEWAKAMFPQSEIDAKIAEARELVDLSSARP